MRRSIERISRSSSTTSTCARPMCGAFPAGARLTRPPLRRITTGLRRRSRLPRPRLPVRCRGARQDRDDVALVDVADLASSSVPRRRRAAGPRCCRRARRRARRNLRAGARSSSSSSETDSTTPHAAVAAHATTASTGSALAVTATTTEATDRARPALLTTRAPPRMPPPRPPPGARNRHPGAHARNGRRDGGHRRGGRTSSHAEHEREQQASDRRGADAQRTPVDRAASAAAGTVRGDWFRSATALGLAPASGPCVVSTTGDSWSAHRSLRGLGGRRRQGRRVVRGVVHV